MVFSIGQVLHAQVTTSGMTGFVRGENNEPLVGATVTVTHIPTGSVYRTITQSGGKFDLGNMNPGGPYTINVSFVNYQTFVKSDIFLALGETATEDVSLSTRTNELTTVVVAATRGQSRGGVESSISREKVANLPTVGRNITDLLRTVPQAKLDRRNEGAIAIAGQNNRYNAFYIDGALNNDVFGLAASGTNGGQANIPPISIDAIDQIQVSISPWDASLSGFTGGGINAITRSGTNSLSGSLYFLYRNQDLSGKTPTGLKSAATKLPDFNDKTIGFRVGGPIIPNKLFYFINGEIVRFQRPQVFDPSRYSGNTSYAGLLALADTLRNKYGYEPGGFESNPETVEANRVVAKFDWNASSAHRVSFTYRFNDGERVNTSSSSASTINFFNNGYVFPTTSHTFTGELRSNFNRGLSNRLLVTYADVSDNRDPITSPFPRVSINDGSGRIIFGPDNNSTVNLLAQKNFNLLNIVRFNSGKHSFSFGTDNELNNVYNAFISNVFGNYTYSSLADFYNNAKPLSYSAGYSLLDAKDQGEANLKAAAQFKTLRLGLFFNDELRTSENLTLNFGIRADYFTFVDRPAEDSFTNAVAIPKFAQFYDLQGARSGLKPRFPISISPRLGFTYRVPDEKIVVRGGVGIFTGRVPLVWPGGIYNNNGINQGSFTASSSQNPNALNTIRFRPDPNNQWRASDVGITLSKGGLNLISKEFRLPKIIRASLGFDKQLGAGWSTTIEGFVTKNMNEIFYTNVNILPPVGVSVGPGSRNVYPAPNTIPLTSTGGNPYDNAILLRNLEGKKGFSYNFTFSIDKRFQRGFSVNALYNYGESVVVHEQTSSINLSQWRFMESVNGRNFLGRSVSDFSPGHRVMVFASKKFSYLKNRLATTISAVYTGESGAPFSYVYGNNTMVRDDANSTVSNDLIYVPTAADIQTMTFLTNTVNGVAYTAAQQRASLEQFITENKYLNSRRGQFSERNADRMPFTHIVDLRVAQDFNLKVGAKNVQFQITYDIFNFTNMLNRDWGRTYFLSNDQLAAISFAGYVSATNFTPQYRFNPTLAQPGKTANISTSTAPSFSPRWTSQLGIRFNF
jgi:outer membrane receptor for ferrienterochelin and colicin